MKRYQFPSIVCDIRLAWYSIHRKYFTVIALHILLLIVQFSKCKIIVVYIYMYCVHSKKITSGQIYGKVQTFQAHGQYAIWYEYDERRLQRIKASWLVIL